MEPTGAAYGEAERIKDLKLRTKYLRVMEGGRRRDAIYLYCHMMCQNWNKTAVANCPNSACPLWPYRVRPERDKALRKRKTAPNDAFTAECTQCKATIPVQDAEPTQNDKGEVVILCPQCRSKI